MNDLEPWEKEPPPLLSAGARFLRGFKRVGLAAGAMMSVLFFFITAESVSRSQPPWAMFAVPLGAGALTYGFFWLIGWILAGFTKD